MDDLQLDIVAKSAMNQGFCYVGLTKQNRLLRPIWTTHDNLCCWTDDFENCHRLSFIPRFFPPYCHTAYPHKNEDVLVLEGQIGCPMVYESQSQNVYNRLKCQAKPISKLYQIFDLEEDKYVEEGQDCPSVAVVRCREDRLNLYRTQDNKLRLQFLDKDGDELYDFRMTGLEYRDQPQDSDDEALVLLGLGRPWDNDGEYYPARCYVLALNIFTQ